MSKGTPSEGKKSGKKNMYYCRRCGKRTRKTSPKVCASCGFGRSARLRNYNWRNKRKDK